ncbi:hypothetical protein CNR22_09060 [Sphingobacteriaceae bacterium]|nr:hypothetical protein CNR22_09060 [Sphingobacteriaceae bacterium]
MQTEEKCKTSERYLFADTYFSDEAIEIWKSECVKRCKDKEKGRPYNNFTKWTRKPNEIAVFTLYAYADLSVPKQFDIIFELDNPSNFRKINFELTQSIYEAWFPTDSLDHGHKHLCIFQFDHMLPEIFKILNKETKKISDVKKGLKMLGFCNSQDFSEIAARRQDIVRLKQIHGDNWHDFDKT